MQYMLVSYYKRVCVCTDRMTNDGTISNSFFTQFLLAEKYRNWRQKDFFSGGRCCRKSFLSPIIQKGKINQIWHFLTRTFDFFLICNTVKNMCQNLHEITSHMNDYFDAIVTVSKIIHEVFFLREKYILKSAFFCNKKTFFGNV